MSFRDAPTSKRLPPFKRKGEKGQQGKGHISNPLTSVKKSSTKGK